MERPYCLRNIELSNEINWDIIIFCIFAHDMIHRKTSLLLLTLFTSLHIVGQETLTTIASDTLTRKHQKAEVALGTDIVSQYIWRGMEMGSASLQPFVGVSWRGLCISANGNVGIVRTSDPYEIDITASYTIGGLTVGLIDYWSNDYNPHYFHYKGNTGHLFEGYISYDFGILNISWQTIFAGCDGKNNNGKRAYSSYFELNVPFHTLTCDWNGTVGVVPYATSYYNTKGIALTNISLRCTKKIPITQQFQLPLYAQLMANPYQKDFYIMCGITLSIN